ncbi:hypothetical protein AG1IA_01759 [Rhizoctonia solani AG-1 IA]|uniref:Uncharacterized protein n=1 Tax=Thanatephorus cucumeris (strain AG1-IA) TaxID=983506 RepID=L8X524_THACA|nr:hypothetical protein AG1IA_01759 [Rhizoctonia solani AG-1 IA]
MSHVVIEFRGYMCLYDVLQRLFASLAKHPNLLIVAKETLSRYRKTTPCIDSQIGDKPKASASVGVHAGSASREWTHPIRCCSCCSQDQNYPRLIRIQYLAPGLQVITRRIIHFLTKKKYSTLITSCRSPNTEKPRSYGRSKVMIGRVREFTTPQTHRYPSN